MNVAPKRKHVCINKYQNKYLILFIQSKPFCSFFTTPLPFILQMLHLRFHQVINIMMNKSLLRHRPAPESGRIHTPSPTHSFYQLTYFGLTTSTVLHQETQQRTPGLTSHGWLQTLNLDGHGELGLLET